MIAASVLTSVEQVAARDEPILLLYSGGLDGTYLLHWARTHDVDVRALHMYLGPEDLEMARRGAAAFDVPLTVYDGRDEFANEFIAAAIQQNAWYHGLYPVSSTLTRPLMARAAVATARAIGVGTIAHTSTYMQNTAMRFASAILTMAPEMTVAAPFTSSTLTRPEKLAALSEHRDLVGPSSRYSVDENPWARVIENDTLEDPESVIPDTGVFRWTTDPAAVTRTPEDITLDFETGLPTALDGTDMPLLDIVTTLNAIAGQFGIGRFSGLESIAASGLKNHEVREAPAAAVLTLAHRSLEGAVLTDDEQTIKSFLDNKATSMQVAGDWFGDLTTACRQASQALNSRLVGQVKVRLHPGTAQVIATRSPNGLYYTRFGADFPEMMRTNSVATQVSLATLPARLRVTTRTAEVTR